MPLFAFAGHSAGFAPPPRRAPTGSPVMTETVLRPLCTARAERVLALQPHHIDDPQRQPKSPKYHIILTSGKSAQLIQGMMP